MVEEAKVRIVVDDSALDDIGGAGGMGGDGLPGDRSVDRFRRQMADRRVGRNGLPEWVAEDRPQLAGERAAREAAREEGRERGRGQQVANIVGALVRGDRQQAGNLLAGLVVEAIRDETKIGQAFTRSIQKFAAGPGGAAAVGVGVGLGAARAASSATAAGFARLGEMAASDFYGGVPADMADALEAYRDYAEDTRRAFSFIGGSKRALDEGMTLAKAIAMTGQTVGASGIPALANGVFGEQQAMTQTEQRMDVVQSENLAEGGYRLARELARTGASALQIALFESLTAGIR